MHWGVQYEMKLTIRRTPVQNVVIATHGKLQFGYVLSFLQLLCRLLTDISVVVRTGFTSAMRVECTPAYEGRNDLCR